MPWFDKNVPFTVQIILIISWIMITLYDSMGGYNSTTAFGFKREQLKKEKKEAKF